MKDEKWFLEDAPDFDGESDYDKIIDETFLQAEADRMKPTPWDLHALWGRFDPEDAESILNIFKEYLTLVVGLKEQTVNNHIRRLKMFAREYKGKEISLPGLYENIDKVIEEYYLASNVHKSGAAGATLKKLGKMKEHLDFCERAKAAEAYIEAHYRSDTRLPIGAIRYEFSPEQENTLQKKIDNHASKFALLLREYIAAFVDSNPKYEGNAPALYTTLGISKNIYSQIMNNDDYRASKETVFTLAFAMELEEDDTEALLNAEGLAFDYSDKRDIIVMFMLEENNWHIHVANRLLEKNNLITLEPRSYKEKQE